MMQAQNLQNAQQILSKPLQTIGENSIVNIAPKYRHKLYVKSKDNNCEYAYDYFARKYNKDMNAQNPNGLTTGYTKISKRENLERQIEVINILRQPELRPDWIKGVPCLLKYNPADDSWKEFYGSKCMQEMYKIALNTPPDTDVKDAHVAEAYNESSGFPINNTFEYANDPRYKNSGKISGQEMQEMDQIRQTQDQRYRSQQPGSADFTIPEDGTPRVDYNQYLARRSQIPQPTNQVLMQPQLMY